MEMLSTEPQEKLIRPHARLNEQNWLQWTALQKWLLPLECETGVKVFGLDMQKFGEIPFHKCKDKINEECRNQNGKKKWIILEKKSGAQLNLLIKY